MSHVTTAYFVSSILAQRLARAQTVSYSHSPHVSAQPVLVYSRSDNIAALEKKPTEKVAGLKRKVLGSICATSALEGGAPAWPPTSD